MKVIHGNQQVNRGALCIDVANDITFHFFNDTTNLQVCDVIRVFLKCTKLAIFEFFPNYQQHKVGISGNHFFPFVSFVSFILVTHNFVGKC